MTYAQFLEKETEILEDKLNDLKNKVKLLYRNQENPDFSKMVDQCNIENVKIETKINDLKMLLIKVSMSGKLFSEISNETKDMFKTNDN